jgi:hypothetical protein
MRPMMRLILGLCALVVILAAVSLALPSHVTIARTQVIGAPETVVFPYLNNLHRFGDWSPWAARDPNLQVNFSGPEEGKGAKVEWTSAVRSVGPGSMEITGSDPNRHIDLAATLNGLEGTAYYEVAPSGSGVKVTWGFGYDTGTSPLKRWKGLLLDRYVGAEYRDGLAKLKDRIETERRPTAPSAAATPPMTTSTTAEQPSAATPGASPASAAPAADPAQTQATAAPPAPPAPAAPATKKKKQH